MNTRTHRRQFLKTSAAIGVGTWFAASAGRAQDTPPSEKLAIAIIGVAGRGGDNMNAVAGENIVALCDVDARNLAKAKERFPQAKTYVDWREAVDHADLDAVVVSTADQVHAPASVWAMRRGLSVYCEKPLAHNVYEARVVQDTYKARRDKLATQMGTQIDRKSVV